MTLDDRWLAAVWPFVRGQLPQAPATVLEVGCGSLGGFVPALLDDGYQAVGVDPEAPEGSDYQRVELEHYDPPWPVECVVASTSLHHVADLDEVLDRLEALLVPGAALVVVEWAWASQEGLHPGEEIVQGLDARFSRQLHAAGPYYFADLAGTSEAEEQAAIDAGLIRAGGIRYAAKQA